MFVFAASLNLDFDDPSLFDCNCQHWNAVDGRKRLTQVFVFQLRMFGVHGDADCFRDEVFGELSICSQGSSNQVNSYKYLP